MNIIILMTALLPTTGHADLIRFAQSIPQSQVYVLINGRDHEPFPTDLRVDAFKEHFTGNVVIKGSVVNHAPQNPEDMVDGFWQWWADEINVNFPEVEGQWDYVVASESYGAQVALSLNAEFLPYDIARSLNPVKGTKIREDLRGEWSNILPEFRTHLQYRAVMFGQESVGKTTISRLVAERLSSTWAMEYARPYLEEVGAELSMNKMEHIHIGQAALQSMIRKSAVTPFAVFDTDLFSTVGYYRIYDEGRVPQQCIDSALELSADMYYVLPDTIPFVSDILRYGGHERETDTQFWVSLLEEYELPYVVVPSGSIEDKVEFIVSHMLTGFIDKTRSIKEFERD